jgi:hypothetical protein
MVPHPPEGGDVFRVEDFDGPSVIVGVWRPDGVSRLTIIPHDRAP